jgi:hypothetical protein
VSPPPPTRAGGGTPRAYPVEEFLQALTAQLDRAQDALAVKVTGTNRPLTWALKDISIDLRVFLDVNPQGRVTLRSAGANEEGASTVHLSLTTITRPMVEENAVAFHQDLDPRPIDDLVPMTSLGEDEQRRLDWMGIRTVGQLKQLDPNLANAVVGLPIGQLQAALEAAARPTVRSVEALARPDGPLLRIRGANLSDVVTPEVHLGGEPVEVLEHHPTQLLVRPLARHQGGEGQVEVFVRGQRATGFFRLAAGNGGGNGGNGGGNGSNGNGAGGNGRHATAPASREGGGA